MPRINEANLEEHRRHTMNALLDSAEKIMREQGGDALTPANVSKGAGIARNSIYRYVKDMKDLRRQLMARHMPQWVAALEKGLGDITDPAETIVQWVKINLEQSILQGHDWMTQIPLSDAQTYRDDKKLWPKAGSTTADGDSADDTPREHHQNGDMANGNESENDVRNTEYRGGKTSPSAASSNRRLAESYPAASGDYFGCPVHHGKTTRSKGPQTPNDQPLEPTQPSLHERVNAPIVAAWGQLCPQNPQVGIAVTEGLVSSGMKLLSGKGQTREIRADEISDIERAIRAIVKELREDN